LIEKATYHESQTHMLNYWRRNDQDQKYDRDFKIARFQKAKTANKRVR
jgi:hypothetical protein